jgi:acyl-CoA thioester hydrolase
MTNELLAGYPVVIEQPVAWGEQDSFRHVNNAVYFRYFENTRIEYMRRLDWFALLERTGVGPILATAQARFRRAVTYPDTLLVGARVSALTRDRFTMEYKAVSTRLGEVTTLGDSVVVTYHYAEQRKVPVPDELRRRLEELEGKAF